MNPVFSRERAEDVVIDIVPLMVDHNAEVSDDITKAWPLDVNTEAYKAMDRDGLLRVFTVRDDGELVGYAIFVVAPSMHRRSLICAHEDAMYLDPAYRRMGIFNRFKDFIEAAVKPDAALVMYHAPQANPRMGTILAKTGYTKYAEYFARVL